MYSEGRNGKVEIMKIVQLFLKSGEVVYFHADGHAENEKDLVFYNGEELAGTFRKYAVLGFCYTEERE